MARREGHRQTDTRGRTEDNTARDVYARDLAPRGAGAGEGDEGPAETEETSLLLLNNTHTLCPVCLSFDTEANAAEKGGGAALFLTTIPPHQRRESLGPD